MNAKPDENDEREADSKELKASLGVEAKKIMASTGATAIIIVGVWNDKNVDENQGVEILCDTAGNYAAALGGLAVEYRRRVQ